MSTAHVEDLIDLEALGALDAEESSFVRAHLADCARCRALLNDAESTTARIALSVPLHRAPASLRDRVIAEVTGPPAALPLPRSRQSQGAFGGALMRFNRRWGAMAALILVVPLTGLLAWAMFLQNEVNDLKRENQQIQETQTDIVLMALPNSLRRDFAATEHAGAARGMVSWNPDAGKCMVRVHDLPPPEPGASYQVFFQGQLGPRSAGELKPDDEGFASLVFDTSKWQGAEYQVWVSSVRQAPEPSTILLQASLRRN
jgi:hypothetical protein